MCMITEMKKYTGGFQRRLDEAVEISSILEDGSLEINI